MSAEFTAACIQFTAGPDPEPNPRQVADLVRRAREAGADLIMTPEASNLIASGRQRRDNARREADDPFLAGMRDLARETGAWLLLGSLVIDPSGEPGATEGECSTRSLCRFGDAAWRTNIATLIAISV